VWSDYSGDEVGVPVDHSFRKSTVLVAVKACEGVLNPFIAAQPKKVQKESDPIGARSCHFREV
jgi:hypothetical protein